MKRNLAISHLFIHLLCISINQKIYHIEISTQKRQKRDEKKTPNIKF